MRDSDSFDVTEYGGVEGDKNNLINEKLSVIETLVRDYVRKQPNIGVHVKYTRDLVRVTFACYEMHLPVKMRETEQLARQTLDDVVRSIKKGSKSMTKGGISLTEQRELANYTVQKVSLNERYLYTCWRFYKID